LNSYTCKCEVFIEVSIVPAETVTLFITEPLKSSHAIFGKKPAFEATRLYFIPFHKISKKREIRNKIIMQEGRFEKLINESILLYAFLK
jgi:hypothetical protein